MTFHRILVGIAVGMVVMLGTAAQAEEGGQSISPKEFRERLIEWATVSERAYKMGDDLAAKITSLSDEQIEGWLALIEDPKAFLASTERVVRRQQERAVSQSQGQGDSGLFTQDKEKLISFSSTPTLTTPFPPDYPPGTGAYKDTIIDAISGYSIGGASDINRCDASDWGDYIGVWWPLNETFDALDGACVVAGCDPTGIGCAITCGILEIAKVALKVAAVPLEACDIHQGAIDGAEIEATYENTLGLVGDVSHLHDDLTAHDTNIDGDLAAHDTNIDGDLTAHDTNIDGDLAAHDTNIDGDLAAHDANIDADLAAHDANIDADLIAHDANIDGDLQTHDTAIKGLLGGVQATLDEEVELRRVHMQVLQLVQRQRYLVTTNEAGVAVSVEFLPVEVFNEKTASFEIVSTATATELGPGLYDLELNLKPKSPDKVFRLRVRHDDAVDHFGEILFHRTSTAGSN